MVVKGEREGERAREDKEEKEEADSVFEEWTNILSHLLHQTQGITGGGEERREGGGGSKRGCVEMEVKGGGKGGMGVEE